MRVAKLRFAAIFFWTAILLGPAIAQELEWDDRGLRLCASEEPNDLAKRKVCVVDWERSRDLFARYVANAQRQQTGEAD